MSYESSKEQLAQPPELTEFIDGIDWPSHDSKEHLKDIVSMVREGALEKWIQGHHRHREWFASQGEREQSRRTSYQTNLRLKAL